MNSLVECLVSIAQRTRLGALGDDRLWFAAGIENYLVGDLPLDLAITLAWSNACRGRRDDWLRSYAAKYCTAARRVAELGREIRLYGRDWSRDRRLPSMPSVYVGAPRELLYRAFAENESIEPRRKMPSSPRQLARILSHWDRDEICGHGPPIGMPTKVVSNVLDDGGRNDALDNAQTFAQRGRRKGGR